ncbi:TRAP transporter substrate-binding protein [Salinisphaera aquimarina]|uniref:TRAP transporter substrate-binding protein n=1 Tax=Salinisphaera aquimarina TaxID=2094031 RepID=A0ABV7EP03_9GAMM
MTIPAFRTPASVRRVHRLRWLIISVLLVAPAVALAADDGATATPLADLDDLTLHFGTNAPSKSPSGRAVEKFAQFVSERSNGQITVQIYPANQLGSNRDMVEQTALGGLDMAMEGLGILGYVEPVYNLLQVPFLFDSQAHIHKVLDGSIGQRLAASILENRNIKLLSQTWDRLPRQLCSKKPIRSPEDMANVLIRTGSKGATQTFRLLGAKPSSIPLNELYLALQNNVVNAVDLPADYIYNLSLYEVCPYMDVIDHTYGTQFVAMNRRVYEKLPPAYREIIEQAVADAGRFNNELDRSMDADYAKRLEDNGMTVVHITSAQHQAFSDQVADHIDELEAIWPATHGLGAEIRAAAPATPPSNN